MAAAARRRLASDRQIAARGSNRERRSDDRPRDEDAPRSTARRGVVLLEVIFALALFVAAAAVVSGSFSACAASAGRLRLQAVADDLAVTLLSEMQLGLIEPVDDGPYDFNEPCDDWSWEIVTSDMDDVIDVDGPIMLRVEIVIRHSGGQCTRRLTTLVPDTADETEQPVDEGETP